MGWVEDFIKPTGYVAGTDHLTVADLAFAGTFSSVLSTGAFDVSAFEATAAWFDKVKGEIPNYEKANGEGAGIFGGWYKSKLAEKAE